MNPALGEEGLGSTSEKVRALIEANASESTVETWGLRRLAYAIEKTNEGFYELVRFTTDDAEFPKELERVLKITDGILRFLVIRIGE
ncbi:MAG: 30S ribosomal protein S6 [Clostridia bacterium]|nr:30S ribosomal protein S6 [Clostridia bacterium]